MDFEISDGVNFCRRIRGVSAKRRANASHQFARIERLWKVVVGAGFESGNALGVITPGSEHDDDVMLPALGRPQSSPPHSFSFANSRGFAVMNGSDSVILKSCESDS
jgi:hypothetical protein